MRSFEKYLVLCFGLQIGIATLAHLGMSCLLPTLCTQQNSHSKFRGQVGVCIKNAEDSHFMIILIFYSFLPLTHFQSAPIYMHNHVHPSFSLFLEKYGMCRAAFPTSSASLGA